MTKEATSTERALKLALEALELNDAPLNNETVVLWEQKIDEAIIALREALTSVPDWASEAIEQPAQQQEPVVFYRCNGCGHAYEQVHPTSCDCMEGSGFEQVNYYTSPPTLSLAQRQARSADTWVGLTDEDKAEIKKQANYNWETTAGEYASKVQALTEARLRAKNSL